MYISCVLNVINVASRECHGPWHSRDVTFMIWVRSRNCGCLVTWFCYQLIAKPGNKTAAVPWPDPYSTRYILMASHISGKSTHYCPLMKGNPLVIGDSPHKGPVMKKTLTGHDVTMLCWLGMLCHGIVTSCCRWAALVAIQYPGQSHLVMLILWLSISVRIMKVIPHVKIWW